MASENATPTGTPTSTPHVAFASPPAASAGSPIPIPAAEYQRLRSIEEQFTALQAQRQTELEAASQALGAKEQDRLAALGRAGELERTLGEQRAEWEGKLNATTGQLAAARQRYLDASKTATIASLLNGIEFSGNTPEVQAKVAARVRREIEGMCEVTESADGTVSVVERATKRPASEVVPALMQADEWQI